MPTLAYSLLTYWSIGIALNYYFLWNSPYGNNDAQFNYFQKIAANLFLIFVLAPIFPYVAIARWRNIALYKKALREDGEQCQP